jgi:hydroxymethylbilane synthase
MRAAPIRLATRRSELALAQASIVADALGAVGIGVELVLVTTDGDRDRVSPIADLTAGGAFVASLQAAVLDGRADAAVHSAKDLPVDGPGGLVVAAYPQRAAPGDVLVGPALADLAPGSRIGTGSPRRSAQLAAIRPDLAMVPLRGNVDSRVSRVERGELAGAVLAEAGLVRIGRQGAIGHQFPIAAMVPAPGQGALAVEAQRGSWAAEMLAGIDDPEVRAAVEAERSVLARTSFGCQAALGVLATATRNGVRVWGFVADFAGPRRAVVDGTGWDEAAGRLHRELQL